MQLNRLYKKKSLTPEDKKKNPDLAIDLAIQRIANENIIRISAICNLKLS
jgi:hypothetical protein